MSENDDTNDTNAAKSTTPETTPSAATTPLPEAHTPETVAPAAATVAPAAATPVPRRRVPGLAIAGIAVAGLLVVGGIFGGGVLVGSHLPDRGSRLAGFIQQEQGNQFGPSGVQRPDRGNVPERQRGDRVDRDGSETDGTDTGADTSTDTEG